MKTVITGMHFFLGNFTEIYNPRVLILTLDNYATFIDDVALWMTLCDFGTFLGKLDTALETMAGLTNLLYSIVLNYTSFEVS
jgi:hypothetical protein